MNDPHRDSPVLRHGSELGAAKFAMVLLHGRGASAESILELADDFALDDIAYLAPQAAQNTWYPYSFLAPIEENQPWLSSALAKVLAVVRLCVAAGVARERVIVCGFSQGACLGTEFVARNPARYGALIAFTGGLIGPPGGDLHHDGSLQDTPVLLSSGDPDAHVPWTRVESSARELRRMGASVTLLRHPGRQHTILPSEIEAARKVLAPFLENR